MASGAEISKDSLQPYVGNYEITNITITVYTKNDNNIYMLLPGQPEYILVPFDKDKFSIKTLNGYPVEFIINDKNEITGINLIQSNGTFKATKKSKVLPPFERLATLNI